MRLPSYDQDGAFVDPIFKWSRCNFILGFGGTLLLAGCLAVAATRDVLTLTIGGIVGIAETTALDAGPTFGAVKVCCYKHIYFSLYAV